MKLAKILTLYINSILYQKILHFLLMKKIVELNDNFYNNDLKSLEKFLMSPSKKKEEKEDLQSDKYFENGDEDEFKEDEFFEFDDDFVFNDSFDEDEIFDLDDEF